MKTTKLLFAAAALAVLTACNTESPIESAEQNVPVRLSYTTVQATESHAPQARGIARAAQDLNEGTFDSGEAITVRISNTGADTWVDYAFTTGTDGAMTPPEPAPYYPAGSQNIDIAAYYPATAGTSFTVAQDQTADADYKASDLMFASVTDQAKQTAAVELAFSHKMAKLCVNITAGQGVTSITSVSLLNVKPTVSFNQATGEVGEASGTAIRIAMSNEGAAVIPAQTINGGLLSIVTDKGTATYSVTNKEFVAGNKYTLNITVNLREVGAMTAITDWGTGGTSLDDADINPVTTATTPAGLEAVDLGHPGGLKWANMNLGATTVTDYGDYFAWGATTPFYQEGYSQESPCEHWIDGKTGYDWANCPFMESGQAHLHHLTKYTFADSDLGGIWYNGDTFIGDGKTSFADYDYVDDAARANWGSNWRTPTTAEWTWLLNNCTWTWKGNYNSSGMDGYLVTSNIPGYTANSIFLPNAGSWFVEESQYVGSGGFYWSSSLSGDFSYLATYVLLMDNSVDLDIECRYVGHSIRPVKE